MADIKEVKEMDLLSATNTKIKATGLKTGFQAAIDFMAGAAGN